MSTDINVSATPTTFRSRWGFHPCDYELFMKLKRLHKWHWQTVFDFHRWHRWWRKKEEHRRGPEPKFCPLFVEDRPWYKRVQTRGSSGFKVYPKTVVDRGIVDLFRQARVPQPEPAPAFDA